MSARYPESSNNTPPGEESSVGDDSLYRWLKIGHGDDGAKYRRVERWAGLGPPKDLPRGAEHRGVGPEVSDPPLKSTSIHLTDDDEKYEFTKLNGREYEGKLSEISWGRSRKRKVDTSSNRGMSINAEKNRLNVIKRAKTQIRRKAMHNKLNFLITLTTRENIGDREKFGAMVSEWERRVKIKLKHKREWDGITVLEIQKRGAYHGHVAAHGWQPLTMERAEWQKICGGKGMGAINIKPPPGKHGGNAVWGIVELANYLCKYLNKAVGDEHIFDKKTYWHTRGIDNPPVTSILVKTGTEEYWANYIVQFIPGMKKHTWTDYNGAIGRVANF